MKITIPILLLALAIGASAAQATEPGQSQKPLPAADCINTGQINEWHVVDPRTAIVRTGPRRYLVTLRSACPRLGMPPAGLIFRPSPSNAVNNRGRICGEVGETVRSRRQPPCAIESVSRIDKARFDRLRAHAMHHGSAADQPTTLPSHR
ncbi:MAG: hypothetical protein KGJ32_02170 [Xanthomonadaceae bacterium]|nr:hypothetical protein [Xanthomonadaceae bacterium]